MTSYTFQPISSSLLYMRGDIILTVYLIGSINDIIYISTNQQHPTIQEERYHPNSVPDWFSKLHQVHFNQSATGTHLYLHRDVKLEETFFDRDVEKAFMTHSKEIFAKKTKPALLIANQVGNMYTPSLYGGLASILSRWVVEMVREVSLLRGPLSFIMCRHAWPEVSKINPNKDLPVWRKKCP